MRFRLCTAERLRESTKSVQGYNESMYPARDGDDSRFSSVRRSYVPDALTVDVVLAVARHGGMNQAAKYLNVSQQTVSTRVAKLEKHLNTRIFWRGAAGSSTTKVGHQVIRVLEGLERALNDCAHGLKAATNNAVTEGLKLVVSHTVAEIDYPRWAAAFQRRHPQTHLHMRQLNSREAQRHVIQGDAELALVEGNWVAHELHQRVIGHDELIVAAPAHHPWAKSNNHNDLDMPSASIPVTGTAPITKEELQSTPLVLREQGSGTREVVEDALEGLAPPIGEVWIARSTTYRDRHSRSTRGDREARGIIAVSHRGIPRGSGGWSQFRPSAAGGVELEEPTLRPSTAVFTLPCGLYGQKCDLKSSYALGCIQFHHWPVIWSASLLRPGHRC